MPQLVNIDKDYLKWFSEIKSKIRSTQIRAALAANATLIEFYYDLGRMIVEKQAQSAWGDKLVQQLSKDLQAEFPDMKGISYTNLRYCKQFFLYFQIGQQPVSKFVPQFVGELSPETEEKLRNLIFNMPWGHIIQIIDKVKDTKDALFYLFETQKNAWSRDVLALQIKSRLHERQGKAITNFSLTLPEPMSDLAQQTLKDPYIFDFLTMSKPYHEKDIENQLIRH